MIFKVQDSRFKIQRSLEFRVRRLEGLKVGRFLLFTLTSSLSICFLGFLLLTLNSSPSLADVYAPSDSVVLTVGCLDTTFLAVADPDSVWFKWWRDVDGQTILDSAKVTSPLRTGFVRHKIKASDGSDNTGAYVAEAVVHKNGKTGIKTWSWTVKAEFDSITNSIRDANKANFKAAGFAAPGDAMDLVSDALDAGAVAVSGANEMATVTWLHSNRQLTMLDEDSTTLDLDGTTIGTVNNVTNAVKVNGGYVGQCTTMVNEVNVVSTDTVKAEVLDKTGYSLTGDYLARADSSLYMRTDWQNVKNQDGVVNLNRTHVAYVETVDSMNEEIAADIDTAQIKTMNENNLWGASHIWNYETRTLTSGAGSGANCVIIRCKQSSDSSNIALGQIQVLDSVENSTIGLLTSDSQGRGFFALDNGSYCVRMYKPGWQFTVPETLVVSDDEDTAYYADVFDPGSPPQAALCRVCGWIHDINNQPAEGAKIEASIRTIPLRYQNIVISPYYKSTTTDEEGYWYLDLHPNSALNPSNTKYIFFIYSPSGTILRIETMVPDQGSWELQW